MSRSWAGGSTRAWRRTRADVIARDTDQGWGCRAHEEGWCTKSKATPHQCTHQPDEAHHTRGRATTGDDPQHMVASCSPCNLAIGDPTKHDDPAPRPVTQW